MSAAKRKRRIRVPNQTWWYGLVMLVFSAILGYITYTRAVVIVPEAVKIWRTGVIADWSLNLPVIVGKLLPLIATALAAVLALYCFFFGLRRLVPPTVPTLTPKDFRNEPQIPELLKEGRIATFYIPNSPVLKILKLVFPRMRYLTRETKMIVISSFGFVIKGAILAAAAFFVFRYRWEILGYVASFGLNTMDISFPATTILVWIIIIVAVARLVGGITLVQLQKPAARTLMSSAKYEYKAHPNIIYSAVQLASDLIQYKDFPNRVHIDDTKLVAPKPPEQGVFDGSILVESHPQYHCAAHTVPAAILLASGVALIAYGFRYYLAITYPTDSLTPIAFLKREVPLYIRDLLVLIACLGWGRLMLMQAMKLVQHYRFLSTVVHAEVSGKFARSEEPSPPADEGKAASFACEVGVVFRSAQARSLTYQLWGNRELLSFMPDDMTDELLKRIDQSTKKALERQVS